MEGRSREGDHEDHAPGEGEVVGGDVVGGDPEKVAGDLWA